MAAPPLAGISERANCVPGSHKGGTFGGDFGPEMQHSQCPTKRQTSEHCCHVSYQLDSFLFMVLAALSCAEGVRCSASPLVVFSLRAFPQVVLQEGEIMQVPIN